MGKEKRGFASMPPERVREIARMGGKAAHEPGTNRFGLPRKSGHEWTSEEAQKAGRKGGTISRGGRGRLRGGTWVPAATSPHHSNDRG